MRQYAETGLVAIDLANTWDEYLDDPERLPDVLSLRRFCMELGVPALSAPDADPAALSGDSDPDADPAGVPGGSEPDAESMGTAREPDPGAGPVGAVDLDEVRAVRSRLREVLDGDPAQRARALARWAEEAPMRAVVAESAGTPVLRLAGPPAATLGQRLTVRAVTEMLDLAAAGDWDRLRLCAASPCQDAFVDRSRPGRRQFCSTRCANRAHAAASRARHR
ncbi:CGNR zinc finger domain-containing protein [Nonomuraea fuscirosea]|uniref:CGNR zinc finger domain-containing protein n=1 Tax=Nonomuraea fuscirosea TaxID=1291556 RepID=UPI002DD9E63D|nr:CGNR zinc finger domain-containing protein [Nonomuraea fuscirosea]WSA49916.1 CGNR zinc finger domain-containing protein [Nonomuraea fuscirosea]